MANDLSAAGSTNLDGRKQDLREEGERRLSALRDDFKAREEATRTSGEAAISHIRKTNQEENDSVARDYSGLKRRAQHEAAALDESLAHRREGHQATVQALRQDEAAGERKAQDRDRELDQQHQARVTETEARSDRAISETELRESKKVRAAKNGSEQQLRRTEAEGRVKLAEEQERARKAYDVARTQGRRRVDDAKGESERDLDAERADESAAAGRLQSKSHETYVTEQRASERRLSQLKSEDGRRLSQEQRTAAETNRKVLRVNESEGQRVQAQGEADVKERREAASLNLKGVDLQEKEDLDRSRAQFAENDKKNLAAHDERLRTQMAVQRKTATAKESQYREAFDRSEAVHKESLGNQRELYLKALYKQQKTFDGKLALGQVKSADPFYSTRDLGARIEETDDAYVLKARVPAYEKDSVEVKVHGDRITLQTARAHESKMDDGDRKTSVNAYQTFRQDFVLEKPVTPEKLVKRMDDQGNLEVIVPKRSSLSD